MSFDRVGNRPSKALTEIRKAVSTYPVDSVVVSAFGVGLNAQSGYSSYVKAHWGFGGTVTTHYLIGANAYITTATIIYAD